jgi:predicted HTH transcriptional regulator
MTNPAKPTLTFEARILSELAEIDQKIARLTSDRAALQRFLKNVRDDEQGDQEVTRNNSYVRIIVENRILEVLREEDQPVSSQTLFTLAVIVHYGLKEQTFRSYLHRLKQRGLIVQSKTRGRGYWEIAKPPS